MSLDFEDLTWERAEAEPGEQLILDVDGFEGPLDVLLTLARAQKVDLSKISVLQLAEQYVAFIEKARALRLELAADYLVMSAWLAYLKSRLLLPEAEDAEEPSAEELALRLQLRLQRLEAMRESGAALMSRNRLGREVFMRGAPEGLALEKHAVYQVSLYALLKTYADLQRRSAPPALEIQRRPVYAVEEAMQRLGELLGTTVSWTQLSAFLPADAAEPRMKRSALASLFAASLEMARTGRAELRQMENFGPLYLRRREERNDS